MGDLHSAIAFSDCTGSQSLWYICLSLNHYFCFFCQVEWHDWIDVVLGSWFDNFIWGGRKGRRDHYRSLDCFMLVKTTCSSMPKNYCRFIYFWICLETLTFGYISYSLHFGFNLHLLGSISCFNGTYFVPKFLASGWTNNDKDNFVILINLSILGKGDGPNELIDLTCALIAKQG